MAPACQQTIISHGAATPEQAAVIKQMQCKDASLCAVQPACSEGAVLAMQPLLIYHHTFATVHGHTPPLSDRPALLQVPDKQLALGIPGKGATLVSSYMICKLHAAMHACHSLELQGPLL